MSKFWLLPIVLLTVFSCNKKNDESNEQLLRDRYFQLQKIGWKSKTYNNYIDDINFTATEVPVQYYLLKDKGNQNLTTIDSIYNANNQERIIEFTYQHDEEQDLLQNKFTGQSNEEAIKYLSFSVEKDFYVVTSSQDTIPCNGVIYERAFKVTPYQKILLFFSGIKPEDKIQLVYKDYLFNKGIMKFKFKDPYTQIKL